MRFSKATGMPDTDQLNWLGELELRNADSFSTSSFVSHGSGGVVRLYEYRPFRLTGDKAPY